MRFKFTYPGSGRCVGDAFYSILEFLGAPFPPPERGRSPPLGPYLVRVTNRVAQKPPHQGKIFVRLDSSKKRPFSKPKVSAPRPPSTKVHHEKLSRTETMSLNIFDPMLYETVPTFLEVDLAL